MQSIHELAIIEVKNAINPVLESLRANTGPAPTGLIKALHIDTMHIVKAELMTEFIMDISPRSRWIEMIRPYHEEGEYAET